MYMFDWSIQRTAKQTIKNFCAKPVHRIPRPQCCTFSPCRSLFLSLPVEAIFAILTCLLLEHRIIFFSAEPASLTPVIEVGWAYKDREQREGGVTRVSLVNIRFIFWWSLYYNLSLSLFPPPPLFFILLLLLKITFFSFCLKFSRSLLCCIPSDGNMCLYLFFPLISVMLLKHHGPSLWACTLATTTM